MLNSGNFFLLDMTIRCCCASRKDLVYSRLSSQYRQRWLCTNFVSFQVGNCGECVNKCLTIFYTEWSKRLRSFHFLFPLRIIMIVWNAYVQCQTDDSHSVISSLRILSTIITIDLFMSTTLHSCVLRHRFQPFELSIHFSSLQFDQKQSWISFFS